MPNRLENETSPYLLQHAHNPVDWYPWCEEALEKARTEDKPIFVSVGYSACHWCHVMERESFEDEKIASFLNEHFVSIKVDREERPDIDNIYMEAVQVMTGQGGWPMSVFLTHDLEPFFAGTYFPPHDRWGRPGFMSVLQQLADVWEEEPDKVKEVGAQVTGRLRSIASLSAEGEELTREPLQVAARHFDQEFDRRHAGFGQPPKFPPSAQLRLLLHVYADDDADSEDRERALEMVENTLAHMASGGMYDQIGGGFHRYSVDREWLVPHFEKMLYDNALLTRAYTEAHQATGRSFYARIVRESLDYVLREMTFEYTDEARPFFSTQDADSEGEEGKFFVWTPEQLEAAFGEDELRRIAAYWDITEHGNFEGKSIPNRLRVVEEDYQAAFEEIPEDVLDLREQLFELREQRVPPATDEKILASWNGLMVGSMAFAGAVLDERRYVDAAARAATFVLEEMRDDDGDVFRTYKDGRARFPGYLDDYAFMVCGLIDLFEASSELRWLETAEELADRMVELFWDDENGGFFYTAEHHENLIVRQKEGHDGATPASNSMAIQACLRLGVLLDRPGLRDRADQTLRVFRRRMQRMPWVLSEMVQWLDYHVAGPREIVLRAPEGESTHADLVWRSYLPNGEVLNVPADDAGRWAESIPLLEGKEPIDEKPTIYDCIEGVCRQPTHDWSG